MNKAPREVQAVLGTLPDYAYEIVESSFESEALRDAYLEANVVGPAARIWQAGLRNRKPLSR